MRGFYISADFISMLGKAAPSFFAFLLPSCFGPSSSPGNLAQPRTAQWPRWHLPCAHPLCVWDGWAGCSIHPVPVTWWVASARDRDAGAVFGADRLQNGVGSGRSVLLLHPKIDLIAAAWSSSWGCWEGAAGPWAVSLEKAESRGQLGVRYSSLF